MKNKVVYLGASNRETKSSATAEISEIYAGFSRRLNLFIDASDIDAPSMNDGRVSFIADLLNVSRPAVTDWLSKNKPPKETTIFEIVYFFLKHMDAGEDILPARVASWLRYGDEVSPCPFRVEQDEIVYQELIPLAASIIANEAKTLGLGAASYDLEKVLKLTVQTLADFELRESNRIKEVHRLIIQQHIKSHIR